MSSLAFGFLWLLTFVIPWESSLLIPGIGTMGKLVGLLAAPIGVLAILMRGRAHAPAFFHLVAACSVIWVGLTSIWTIDPERTGAALMGVAQAVVIPWLIWELAATPQRRAGLLQAYVFGAYVSALYTILTYRAGVATGIVDSRYAAEGFNPNSLGFLLVLGLAMAWHLSLSQRHPILRWINRLYIPVGVLGTLLTGSRSSLILMGVALFLVPLTLGRLSHAMKVTVTVSIVATIIAAAAFIPAATLARLSTTKDELETGDLNERRVVWEAGLQLVPRHPFLGVGAGAFSPAVFPFLGKRKVAHNTYLSVLVEQGMIGLTLFGLMLVSLYFHARSAPPDERRFAFTLLLILLIGLMPRTAEFEKSTWLIFGLLLTRTRTPSALAGPVGPWMPSRTRPPSRLQAATRRSAPGPLPNLE
ncbi:MAG TPA: O-antigen ligase family protein [Gemmatimonadales bacterium]|nr:O-antigen ligase family protein [Gemmatimonadales bacterium]